MNIRYLPAAITPVTLTDWFQALFGKGTIRTFEDALTAYFHAEDTLTFQSLMRTNYVCFSELKKLSSRKKVLLPRYSCPSFAHGILAAGLLIEYCDIDPKTLCMDFKQLKEKKGDEILAVVCANLFGYTNDVEKIAGFCRQYGIYLIEGVDYGIGTEFSGRKIGTFGDITVLNFQEGKAIPIGGGALVYNNRKLVPKKKFQSGKSNRVKMLLFSFASRPFFYNLFRMLIKMLHVSAKRFSMEDTIRTTKSEYDFKFDANEKICRLSDFQGRLGLLIMGKMERNMRKRNRNAKLYTRLFRQANYGIRLIKPLKPVNRIHYIRYPILVDASYRDRIVDVLLAHKIEGSPMYIEHGMQIDKNEYPGAFDVMNSLVTLPCHPYMRHGDVERCVRIIADEMKRLR